MLIEQSIPKPTNQGVAIAIQERTVKSVRFQMRLKVIGERDHFGREVVVADGAPGVLPEFLRPLKRRGLGYRTWFFSFAEIYF